MANNNVMLSNLVEEKNLRAVQLQVLEQINSVISKTAGPFGSYSMIMHADALTEYTKDGHDVLKSFKYFKPLEAAIHDELLGITEHVIKTVGDGTTSAVEMSYLVFRELCEKAKDWPYSSHQIIEAFQKVTKLICKEVKTRAKDFKSEYVYDICMISTNGNEEVASDIAAIYEKFGKEVFIQLGTSNTPNSITKTYDGVILSKGFASPAYVNTSNNTVVIRNPHFYYFPDPIDTPEMIKLLMTIFTTNIYEPYYQRKPENYVPTVILCPSISRDAESALTDIDKIFYQFNEEGQMENKPPFCIINGINSSVDNIGDIVTLCACPSIKKYINPDVMQDDIEKGLAPKPENVSSFCGTADLVTIYTDRATIVNPQEMFDKTKDVQEDGQYPFSATYTSLLNFLKEQINQLSLDKEDIGTLGKIKRRFHSLTANFVEYNVGGISAADRSSVKALVEDAVLNCRSAAVNGVGYGACIEGYIAACHVEESLEFDKAPQLEVDVSKIIVDAYYDIIFNLYTTAVSAQEAKLLIEKSYSLGQAYNLRTKSFITEKVLCSIDTDICILEAISKIVTIMFSANQAFLVDPMQNAYINMD